VLAGDYNVMPTELDVYKPERWLEDALFRPEVREAFHRLVAQGWTDALRSIHPGERIYTFWDYFRNAYGRNAGLRIDHLLLSPFIASGPKAADVDRKVRGREKPSDHAPTWIELAAEGSSCMLPIPKSKSSKGNSTVITRRPVRRVSTNENTILSRAISFALNHPRLTTALIAFMGAIVPAGPALAAESGHAAPSEGLLLAQIIALVLLARLLGEFMLRIRQPAVMGHLFAGILLGPSVFGLLWPEGQHALFPTDPGQKAMISGLAQFGILMLLLLAGMETDLALVRRVRRAAFTTSAGGILLPFLCGFLLGMLLPEALLPDPGKRIVTALFLGTALSISSVKIVATVIRDMGFLRRDIGQVILASAIVDDTIGWIIIAITLSLASQGDFDWLSVGKSIAGTLAFLVMSFTFGRRIVARLIQWSNDYALGEAPVIATILIVMGAMALTTDAIGVHTVLGAFVAGILVGESPILTARIDDELRGVTAGLFMPVFFGLAGLSADLTILADARIALLTLMLIAIASIGKAAGAFTGGWFGGLSLSQSLALAAGMNARGSTEVIVASIGLTMGVLSQNLFTMIVAMAFITTTAMPPTLRWALNRLPIDDRERKRLGREEIEAESFLASIERVLLVIDDSAKGRFAARMAGLLARRKGMSVTVMKTEPGESALSIEIVKAAAAPARADEPGAALDVIERRHDLPIEEAVSVESQKGYGLMILGIDPTVGTDGGFDERVSRLARSFQGSLAVITARGGHEIEPATQGLKILVPVTGSEVSRRGAEVALALGRAAEMPVTALSVIAPEQQRFRQRFGTRVSDATETAKEIRTLAEAMEQTVRVTQRADISPLDAILREARLGNHDVILMGVSRRPGDRLSFGELAAALLESSDRSLIFLSPRTGT
jgi:Kef-type K+ transport system membrane component KefB/nucleotide-binding universal stress UspA family protein